MGLDLVPKEGDTVLSEEELEELIPNHVTNRKQLDEVEQNNIESAFEWLMTKKISSVDQLLSKQFQDELHKRMLGKVWLWTGKTRKKETNIGVDPTKIEVERKQLIDDTKYWIENKTFAPKEIAPQFHHRLVKIHCYPNGNGRHSRIMADLILERIFNLPGLKWLGQNFITKNQFRDKYIAALKAADLGNYKNLYGCIEYP